MTDAVRTHGLTVRRDGRTILRDVDLRVAPGEMLAIVGRSGAGKSTLLHAISGHLPFEGTIDVPTSIGMVFQRYGVFPWLTVERNVGFGLRLGKEAAAARVAECLLLAELEHAAGEYPAALSGGQRQRIAVARALAHRPQVLLMDEPFGSLDALTRESMQQWLLDVRRTHAIATLLVTHSIEEALLADRVVVLRDGGVSADMSVKGDKHALRSAIRQAL